MSRSDRETMESWLKRFEELRAPLESEGAEQPRSAWRVRSSIQALVGVAWWCTLIFGGGIGFLLTLGPVLLLLCWGLCTGTITAKDIGSKNYEGNVDG